MPILREKTRADIAAAVELYKIALTGTYLEHNDDVLIELAYMSEWDTCEEFIEECRDAAIKEANEMVPEQYQKYLMSDDDIAIMISANHEGTIIQLADSIFDLKDIFQLEHIRTQRLHRFVKNVEYCRAEYY